MTDVDEADTLDGGRAGRGQTDEASGPAKLPSSQAPSAEVVLGAGNIAFKGRKPIPGFPGPSLFFAVMAWPCKGKMLGDDGTLVDCDNGLMISGLGGDGPCEWIDRILSGQQSNCTCVKCGQRMHVRRGLIAQPTKPRGLSLVGRDGGRK